MKKIITSTSVSAFLALFLFNQSTAEAGCCEPEQCCETYNDCCEPSRFWGEAEYLYWWIKDSPEHVPLVISGPPDLGIPPVLGDADTSVVLGGSKLKNNGRSGGRFTLGYWFCDDKAYGAEVSYLFLGSKSKSHSVSENGLTGSRSLALPFFNPTTGLESSTFINESGAFSGLATLKVKNEMQGAELNGLFNISSCDGFNIKGLVGFRYWNFDEKLTFTTESPSVVFSDVFRTEDRFSTSNNFYGGQIGIDLDYAWCDFIFNVKGKVALGSMDEKVKIRGTLNTNDFNGFGEVQTFSGGYLAQPTNIGNHKKNEFAVIPEFNFNMGYQISDCWSVKLGYTFLYVSKMLYAGKQIDRVINPTQAPSITGDPVNVLVGEARPKPLHKTSHFWAQGLNVGIDYNF